MVKLTKDFIKDNVLNFLRISIGVIYVWFGALKFFPSLSPAELLAEETIELLLFNQVEGHILILGLAGWEVLLGIGLLINYKLRLLIPIMFVHMLCTVVPAIVAPDYVFTLFPFGLTLVGQYIVKNFVFVTSALLLLKYTDAPSVKEA
ncbi:MAG: doxx family protein [Salibacteraceae bacterium]